MSLRRLASSLGKKQEKSSGTSASSTASWSPSTSQSHIPLSSSVSLPDSNILQRYPSPVQSIQSSHSTGAAYSQNATPLRVVAPFAYNAPPEAIESKSSLGSNETKDSETATLRLKRSLTRILGPKEEESNHQYHYQKQSLSRKASKDEGTEGGRRSRKGSFFSKDKEPSSSSSSTISTSGTKKIVSWIGQRQSDVTKKVQDVLKASGSSLQGGQPKAKSRISSDFQEEDDDGRSSISSAPSFVQTAPDDEVSRILSEPDVMPPLPMQALQTPFQIPANVFLPRSHTNLHALTLASLAFPPSLHPLLYIPNLPAFPRSSNPSSKLPRLPTFRAHLAKTRILDRLEAQDLTLLENESILPFAKDPTPPEPVPLPLTAEGENEEGRKINDSPGRSVGLEAWTRRPPALQRFRVWQRDAISHRNGGDGDNIKYEPLSASTSYRTELVISGGTKALAGLVPSSPTLRDRDLSDPQLSPPRTLPILSGNKAPSMSLESFASRSLDSLVLDESMLMDTSEALPLFAPNRPAAPSGSVSSGLVSPRPLPNLPGNRPAEAPTPAMAIQQMYWANQEEDYSPVIPVRPLPPRPLPMPPGSPQVTVDELESIDGPVIVTTTIFTPTASPRQSMHLSPPGSMNGHTMISHNGLPSSSTITSAPHTPMDHLEAASLRRISMGSMSVVLSGTTSFSLEEMDGLEMTTPHDLDSKRRSVASFKTNVHKRRSTASRTSHASSPSLLHHPLPTLSESSRYSESSHLSSKPTHNDSSSASMEALSRRTHPSMSSGEDHTEQVPDDLPSPIAVVGPCGIAEIKGEELLPLEPSRMSHEQVDPFLIPQLLTLLNPPDSKLDPGLNESPSPMLSQEETRNLLSPEGRALSISVDLPMPTPPKSEQRSPQGTSGQASPASSMQSPADSQYTPDDVSRNSTSPAPVKFVRLKRSGSSADSGVSNGTGVGTNGGGRLQRTLKDPSKFWPHNRRVDEKGEDAEEECPAEKGVDKSNHASWLAERESLQVAAGAGLQAVEPPAAETDDRPESGVSISETVVPHRESKPSAAAASEQSPSPTDLSSLPPDLAFDVARLSDTSKLDLTLYTPQKTPLSTNAELPRRSVSSARSESESASRFADVREIAATMSPVPSLTGTRVGGPSLHMRTPSSERAARIDAHLESVSSSRYRPRMGTRPEFLPYPGHSRSDYGNSRQSRDEPNQAYSDNSHNGLSEDESRTSGDQSEDGLPRSPPPGHGFAQRHPVSRPPARWSEASWKERQRSLNTLPLPSASISHSATRPLPYGNVINRTGSSSVPSIFRPTPSQPGTIHGRSLRM